MTDVEIALMAIAEAESEWEVAKAKFNAKLAAYPSSGVEPLVAEWMRIFLPEEALKDVLHGLPMGETLERHCQIYGMVMPPEIQAYYDAWWQQQVAYDISKDRWLPRTTPEGIAALATRRMARPGRKGRVS